MKLKLLLEKLMFDNKYLLLTGIHDSILQIAASTTTTPPKTFCTYVLPESTISPKASEITAMEMVNGTLLHKGK